MNIKKMFTTLSAMVVAVTMTLPSASVFGASYSQELQDAYNWAHDKGITTMSSIDNANMYGAITRAEMAKMLSVYAMEVLGSTANEAAVCEFTDIDSVKGDLHEFIKTSCQLGIMGQNMPNNAFRPYDTISRAEFGTALSRLLWGSKYEGGTPYYANHLNALKADGIMNQIANAESTKEIRGYVMLMLMRSEQGGAGVDCDDADIALACLDPEADLYKECPAACREDNSSEDNTGEKVKSGDLVVTAEATSSRSAIRGAASDLDTLTFKTSEEVEITKVVLERYGYSAYTDVESVRLEDENGTVIAEDKAVNSKDQVTLTIKKGYRSVDGTFNATVVAVLTGNSGSTIGFKVVDVTSTAKNVDLGNYRPYTYDIVDYDAVKVTIDDRGSNKDYNYEEGESYEVAKIKVKANSSALEVNGFTLTNVLPTESGARLDLEDFVKKVEVVVDGNSLKGVSFKADDDELTISFDSYEIAAKGNETFTINIALEGFDEYGQGVKFAIDEPNDIKITEKKTGARVSIDKLDQVTWHTHFFNGSKIKFSSNKLGSVDAAQGSDDILILDGEVEVAEGINKWNFTITGTFTNLSTTGDAKDPIEDIRVMINGDEFAPKSRTYNHPKDTSGAVATYSFEGVEIEESGKVQVLIDVEDTATQGAIITFQPTFNKNVIAGAKYSEVKEPVKTGDVKGSISFATRVTVQPSKASLENDLTKRVEFTAKETTKKVVFDGTYTAKKGEVNLDTVSIKGGTGNLNKDVTFYVYIDGEEVATLDPDETDTFSSILVKAGKSVKVKVEAEVSSDEASATVLNYVLELSGEDENGNENAGKATESLVDMKVVDKGTFNITVGKSKNTVLLKARNTTLGEFTIKPSNNNEGLTLEDIYLSGHVLSGNEVITLKGKDLRFKIDGIEYTAQDEDATPSASGILYEINEEIPSAGVSAEIILKDEYSSGAVVEVTRMNGLRQGKSFSKFYAPALVYIDSQENQDSFTQYILGVDLYEDGLSVTNLKLYSNTGCTSGLTIDGLAEDIYDGDDFTIDNEDKSVTIRCIEYNVDNVPYKFNNSDFADYFKDSKGSAWRVFANGN